MGRVTSWLSARPAALAPPLIEVPSMAAWCCSAVAAAKNAAAASAATLARHRPSRLLPRRSQLPHAGIPQPTGAYVLASQLNLVAVARLAGRRTLGVSTSAIGVAVAARARCVLSFHHEGGVDVNSVIGEGERLFRARASPAREAR